MTVVTMIFTVLARLDLIENIALLLQHLISSVDSFGCM